VRAARDQRGVHELREGDTDPVNIRAQVEYAVIAWSCSPSSANVCANATHAGPNLGSINEVLLQNPRAHVTRNVVRESSWDAPKVLPRKSPLSTREIPYAHCIPANWILWLPLDHLVSEYEELGMEMR
jgi:hypothetical protein